LPTSAIREASIASWSTPMTCRFVSRLKSRGVMPALVRRNGQLPDLTAALALARDVTVRPWL